MAKKSQKPKAKSTARKPSGNLLRAVDMGKRQERFGAASQPHAEMMGVQLGRVMGLAQVGVSIVRMPAGGESAEPHHRIDEWFYILAGQGSALVGGKDVALGMGDFLAFPRSNTARHLRNIGADDLVFLTGGAAEARPAVAASPRKPKSKR